MAYLERATINHELGLKRISTATMKKFAAISDEDSHRSNAHSNIYRLYVVLEFHRLVSLWY